MRRSAAVWLVILAAPLLGAAEQSPLSLNSSAAALRAQQAAAEAARKEAERARLQRQAEEKRKGAQAAAAGEVMERSLANVRPVGVDGLAASSLAALAAQAAAQRQSAQRDAQRLSSEAAQLAAVELEAAQVVAALDAQARAREEEARIAAQKAAAARAAAAKTAAKKKPPARPSPASLVARPAMAAAPAAVRKLVEGGGELIRSFQTQVAGGPPSNGITLRTRPSAGVLTPRDAQVIHTGLLRGGGHVLILQDTKGYLLVFAGLGELSAAKGMRMHEGDRIGAAPASAPATLEFEVRKGGLGIDPLAWLSSGR